ncbi:MAG: threonine/serine dehydratase [Myxococcota bacterium]
MTHPLTLETVRMAAARIRPYVLRTPTLRVPHEDCDLWCKAESLQSIGAFKLRGAFSLMTTLPKDCAGVVTDSSGNHAQAVARAAKVLGIKATIVMPEGAPPIKRARAAADGATIVTGPNDSEALEALSKRIAQEQGLCRVPPYDHPLIAAGQGSAALELLEDATDIDQFFCPVSGGGLISGCATVFAALSPKTEIIGVEPELANDTYLSLQAGERTKIPPPNTLADGLRVRIPGAFTWTVIKKHVNRIALVSEDAIQEAMIWATSHLRLVLEPSGATALAAALAEGRGRCAVLLSGGNVDPKLFAEVLNRVH